MDLQETQNVIENLVHIREKKTANIQDINKHLEITNVKRKKNKIQKPATYKTQKKKLSRNEMKNLGLYSLPRKTLIYDDYIKLNELWNSYIEQQLGSNAELLPKKFDITSSQYDLMSGIFHKSDFHGAKLKVIQSKCASLVGIKGIVILDTKGTFNLICKDNVLRIIPKNASIFQLKWNKIRFVINGKNLSIRTAERSVKKTKAIYMLDLS